MWRRVAADAWTSSGGSRSRDGDLARRRPPTRRRTARLPRPGPAPESTRHRSSAMPARHRPSAAHCTAHATPASAKSPCRRATSSIAKPRAPGPHRKRCRHEELVGRDRGGPRADEEVVGARRAASRPGPRARAPRRARPRPRDTPTPGRRARATRRPCRGCGSGSGRRSGVARASERHGLGHRRVALHHALARHRADAQRSVLTTDAGELRDAVQVDEVFEARQSQREHRHEALPAGQHLDVVAVLHEQVDDVRDALGSVVHERRRFHATS